MHINIIIYIIFVFVIMSNLFIISGCNGAGKTTASFSLLPKILNCNEFVNADEIARGLSPFQPEKASIEAGRIMLSRIRDLTSKKIDFAIETTLASKTYYKFIEHAKEQGYFISLVFFWLSSPELAQQRVKARVELGGHNIPKDIIYRRYKAGIKNLNTMYLKIADFWMIIDNSQSPYKLVAEGIKTDSSKIHIPEIFNQIIQL